jgi:hypothetical protein
MGHDAIHHDTNAGRPSRGPGGISERPIAIERATFLASLHATATRALLADAYQLLDSGQFPPEDPAEFRR